MVAKDQNIQTEADALREIIVWSRDRPLWQRDALRRLVKNAELSEKDISELTDICKGASTSAEPLEESHIALRKAGSPTISLKNLKNASNINALAEGQTLNFLTKGVTIVYGDNGAGKSGYVRILKRACRARAVRGKEEPVLHNIYDAAQIGTQSAEIEYFAGAQSQRFQWKNGEKVDNLLSEISVFDSRTANVHVDETNDLAYTPSPMKLLEQLVLACQAVKKRLDAEVFEIKAQTPKSITAPRCAPETQVGSYISSLSGKSKIEELDELVFLEDQELVTLNDLSADLANDPKLVARRLRAQKARLESVVTHLKKVKASISDGPAHQLAQLRTDFERKQETADVAARAFSDDEHVPGVGSDVWRNLWEAARAFSSQVAYPGETFPYTKARARCVLCHQELNTDALSRMSRFERFIKDRTQNEAQTARDNLASHVNALWSTRILASVILEDQRFIRDELASDALALEVRNFSIRANLKLRAMVRQHEGNVALSSCPLKNLNAVIDDLEARAAILLADDDSAERKAMRTELQELKDRNWLAGVRDDVAAEIERMQAIANLEQALSNTRATAITSKNTALSQALITDRLRTTFTQEINQLNLSKLAIELTQASSQYGVSRFKISLMKNSKRNAGEVLSEGEFRCVAIAGFLAELSTSDSTSGIIFDDPVSSLDHLHREAIAKRLAQIGRERQVIVFTHDLPFLFMLRNACVSADDSGQRTEVALRHVQKRQNIPGYCRNEAPSKAQDTATRLGKIRAHLDNTRRFYEDDPDSIDWLVAARGLIDSVRQTWETAVEDTISPVLRTFAHKVNTVGFGKLSAITEQDAIVMRRHYGQCSEYLHNISDQINPSAPVPKEIEAEIDALEAWLQNLLPRQKKIKVS